MEFFGIFSILFFVGCMLTLIIIIIGVNISTKQKEKLKIFDNNTFDKYNMDFNFNFKCEYCNTIIDTTHTNCPQCGGNYNMNKEYKEKKYKKNQEYLTFLKNQDEQLKQEVENIKTAKNLIKKNIFMKNSFYNLNLNDKYKKFTPSKHFEFICEYCGNKIRGKSTDKKSCPNCNAPYDNNIELLILEEKENIEYNNHLKYQVLQSKIEDQNIENILRDNRITQKTIKLAPKIAKFIYILIGIIVLINFFNNL